MEAGLLTSGLPFDDFRLLLNGLPGPDDAAAQAARDRNARLAKPVGALGRMEEIAEWLAAWTGRAPAVTRPLVALFAGNHGVTAQDVTPDAPSMTAQMVEMCAAGGAAINQICIAHDLGLKVFDLALDLPTADITRDAAMDERSCAATMAFGMESIAGGTDLLCVGAMGIGNTVIAAAIFHALYGANAEDWVETGTDPVCRERAIDAVERAVALHKAHLSDPFEVLRRLGGREVAAIAGAILAARVERIPVIVDSAVATSAAAVLHAANPAALDHCLIGHVSGEPAHRAVLDRLGKVPLLDLGIRLGSGEGAALAAGVIRAATLCHSGMATAEQAGLAQGTA